MNHKKKIRVHTEKSFRNLIKSNQIQIVFTIVRLIWRNQTDVRLVPQNQSEDGKYNLISGKSLISDFKITAVLKHAIKPTRASIEEASIAPDGDTKLPNSIGSTSPKLYK